MIISQPSRPKFKRIKQQQPHLAQANVGNISITSLNTSVDTGAPGRQTVLESGFSSTYKTDFDWSFDPDLLFNDTTMDQSFTTLNGFDAISVTWKGPPNQATHNDRWGADLALPLLSGFENGYDEGWLTHDFMFVSPFSSPRGVKLVAPEGAAGTPSTIGQCDGGWLYRLMLGRNLDNTTNPRIVRSRLHYVDGIGELNHWDNEDPLFVLDTVVRTEMYFKLNTAFDAADGIIIDRYDVGTATEHATPQTIRNQRNDMRMYCGSEANRNAARVKSLKYHVIFGGNTSAWWPTLDSEIIFGRVKFETTA